jgi:hypothetical protein
MHLVRTRRSSDEFPRDEHLAAKIAEVAVDPVAVESATAEMVANRIIDNAAVSAAAVLRRPVTVARQQALAHPARQGATVFGVNGAYSAEWVAWANSVAVRELDFHAPMPIRWARDHFDARSMCRSSPNSPTASWNRPSSAGSYPPWNPWATSRPAPWMR